MGVVAGDVAGGRLSSTCCMYMLPAPGEVTVPRPPRTAFSLALCVSAAAVLVLGIVPGSVLAFAERSILSLLM